MALFGKKKNKEAKSAAPTASDAAPSTAGETPENGRRELSKKDQDNARKWFAQGRKLFDDRNYDYAIESYLEGLKLWPEAVEEGHQLLRVAAVARTDKGGKKPGTFESMKRSMSGKDPHVAMLNAAWLWSHEPSNVAYMEGMIKNVHKAGYEDVLLWMGPIYFEACKNEKKLSRERFLLLKTAYADLGARCEERGDFEKALNFFQGCFTVLQVLNNLSGQNQQFSKELQDMATKITIMKGKYDSGDDFRSSMKDADSQKDIQDRERLVVDQDRLGGLIDAARKAWEADRSVSGKLMTLVELMCRKEDDAREKEAIELLLAEYESTEDYRFKLRADDIRLKRLRRKVRQATDAKDPDAAKKAAISLLRLELTSFKERIEQYPTDNKIKFHYGRMLVKARKFDDAIPVLQDARSDAKNRLACMSLIGRCFFEKGYFSQAITTYNQAISGSEMTGDDLAKELHYWLGRSCEEAGNTDEAKAAYGQVIQWDYNFKDARSRLSELEG